MELGRQIKKYRQEANMTQEELADRIFVTRQTVSNWENDKNYPDIKSLLLLSSLFQVSLDTLVKGDLEEMKEKIKEDDVRKFNRDSGVFTVLLIASILSAVPMFFLLEWIGVGIWAILYGITMYYAVRIEKQKKRYDIQSYREIVAFSEGRRLDETEKIRESGKRMYQKILLTIGAAVVALAVLIVVEWILT